MRSIQYGLQQQGGVENAHHEAGTYTSFPPCAPWDHGDHGAGTGRRSPTTLRKISTIEKGYINEYAVFHILFNYYLHYLLFL